MTTNNSRRTAQRGSALIVALIAVIVLSGLAAAMLATSGSFQRENEAATQQSRALYAAEAGLSTAIAAVRGGALNDIGAVDAQIPFAGGKFWCDVQDNGDETATLTSSATVGGCTRRLEVTMLRNPGGVFASALFAGNGGGDPLYDLKLGGVAGEADDINGNVYSGGNVVMTGNATIDGSIVTAGVISGGPTGKTGSTLPIPDIPGMNYPVVHDYDVAAMFSAATFQSSPVGGSAWQMTEDSPAHIFRKNPSDRTGDTSLTAKDDYFLEDPYETLNTSAIVDPAHGTHITLSGQDGNPGEDGGNKIYYIDGNLWIHNRSAFSFTLYNSTGEPVRATFVVRGNIYFSDNVLYQKSSDDAVAFIAIKDSGVADSGNILFGDPSFGTLERMDAFMYAEGNFLDTNLSATGSARVTVNGNMTAGNQVKIQRDFGAHHSKLTVNFDPRLVDGSVTLPGLPKNSGAGPSWSVALWREIPAN